MAQAKDKASRSFVLNASPDDKSEVLVLGWLQTKTQEKTPEKKAGKEDSYRSPDCSSSRKEIGALKEKLTSSRHFRAKKNETSVIRYYAFGEYENVLLIGLGPKEKLDAEVLRQAGAAIYLAQSREKFSHVTIDSESFFGGVKDKELAYLVQAFAEGYLLAGYEYVDLKKKAEKDFHVSGATLVGKKSKELESAVHIAEILAEATHFARSLGDRPGNVLTPTEFARLCTEMAKRSGLKSQVLDGKAIQKEKMGLFWGVAKGSTEDPKMIVLEHLGGKKGEKPIVLIGKGITFDSGGISLKPPARMEDMKYDMMGAATVAGIMQAVGNLKLPVNVVGYIGTSENMPGGKAQKPGDVQTSMSGKTVEIVNTDAEGRLVLADVMEYAQKHTPPAAMMDFATLTGAVVDALGSVTTGIMGNHDGFISRVKDASVHTGERVWQLPLYEEYEEDLKSNYADIRNTGIREAGASKAGTFLKFFVDSKVPWVHCDIAGSAYHRKDLNYHPAKYGAGVMVRLVTQLLQDWEKI